MSEITKETELFITDQLSRMELSSIRKSKKMTQKEVSDACGLSVQCICNIESPSESASSPTMKTLNKYLSALGYEISFKKKNDNEKEDENGF